MVQNINSSPQLNPFYPSCLCTSAIQTAYPNPVKDRLTVEYILSNSVSYDNIYVYNMQGTLVLTHKLIQQYGLIDVDVQGLAQGTYILSFNKDKDSKLSKKFIVQ